MFLSHYLSGTGAIAVEGREYARTLRELLHEIAEKLPDGVPVCTMTAPGGPLKSVWGGDAPQGAAGLAAGYKWLADGPGRILLVYDGHYYLDAPGHADLLRESLPLIRCPRGSDDDDAVGDLAGTASLAVFVGPSWEFSVKNHLRGAIPLLRLPPLGRDGMRRLANKLTEKMDLPKLNGETEAILDAVAGLDEDVAEQAMSECLSANGLQWNAAHLEKEADKMLSRAGLEGWPAAAELGGLSGLQDFFRDELVPWVRDKQLCPRRILCAGHPGSGKSFGTRKLAHMLGQRKVWRLSLPAITAAGGGIVGQAVGALRNVLSVIDMRFADHPGVIVIDEIDGIARSGLDANTSSGLFTELLTWLQESTSKAIVVATLNRLDHLDAALSSRFPTQFWFTLGSRRERQAVAEIHFTRLGCSDAGVAAERASNVTEGWSSREIAEYLCPTVARRSSRKPTSAVIEEVAKRYSPASQTQAEQLKAMQQAAQSLRPANDPPEEEAPRVRKITARR